MPSGISCIMNHIISHITSYHITYHTISHIIPYHLISYIISHPTSHHSESYIISRSCTGSREGGPASRFLPGASCRFAVLRLCLCSRGEVPTSMLLLEAPTVSAQPLGLHLGVLTRDVLGSSSYSTFLAANTSDCRRPSRCFLGTVIGSLSVFQAGNSLAALTIQRIIKPTHVYDTSVLAAVPP